MDYDLLANLLPRPVSEWSQQDVLKWLHFISMSAFTPAFQAFRINGTTLLTIEPPHLKQLGVTSSLMRRKIMRWIKEGLPQYDSHLQANMKQNIPPLPNLHKKSTKERTYPPSLHTILPDGIKATQTQQEMLIRSCDGNFAAFYVMRGKILSVGRSQQNVIRSLEVTIEKEHAEIFRMNDRFFIRDKGSEHGTFIKIVHPQVLQVGGLIELGSVLMEVKRVDKPQNTIELQLWHMGTKMESSLTIVLQGQCSYYSIGRRKTNTLVLDDEHLSGLHCKIFQLGGQFVIEDLHSTNGTWMRLSQPFQASNNHPLEDGTVFKVGTTIAYQCELQGEQSGEKMQDEYDNHCISCGSEKRNILSVPCRHNVICDSCATNITRCPACNQSITEQIKIYV